jgi:molybdopterin molybdotransferase
MAHVGTLGFREARDCVIERTGRRLVLTSEEVDLECAAGRVLAEEIRADRDYPPLDRSVRDGFAVHAADLPGTLAVIGEVRAGQIFSAEVKRGEALEIMTGAPMPQGADAVVMIEHVRREGNRIATERAISPGEAVNPRGGEVREGAVLLSGGKRLGFAEIAMLAAVGRVRLRVYRRPVVAIVATGDEIVEIDQQPLPFQIRNSNAHSLAAQVRRAGGVPQILPVARDNYESTRSLMERALEYDLLLVSGGVSAGKYDIVERVLGDLGAEFFFDRVLIQPGQPLVFGCVRGKFVFGLPGNPVSTMVTFEIFARAAMELLEGQDQPLLPLTLARLSQDLRHKTGLTRFLPARLSPDGAEVTPVRWTGSSDVPALTRANAFLVTEAERESWQAGELIRVMLK